jgi:hypothetical protein
VIVERVPESPLTTLLVAAAPVADKVMGPLVQVKLVAVPEHPAAAEMAVNEIPRRRPANKLIPSRQSVFRQIHRMVD